MKAMKNIKKVVVMSFCWVVLIVGKVNARGESRRVAKENDETEVHVSAGKNGLMKVEGRIHGGRVNPQISPMGAIVDVKTGEVMYVREVVSVLAPKDLQKDCLYRFTYAIDTSVRYKAIRLYPPTEILGCGNSFPKDK